ncbi:MAG: NAD(P)H-binding protein [Haloarculaceae archaeon]
MDRVLVAGATGGTGRACLEVLRRTSLSARGLTRSPDRRRTVLRAGADEAVVGDLFDPADAARAVDGCDAVVSAVGSSPRAVLTADEFVDGVGTRHLVDAARSAGAEAFVMVSALGVGGDGGPLGRVFNAAIGPVQRAKADGERALRESGLRYTILRPGVLLPAGRLGDDVQVAEAGTGLWGAVARRDVARLAVAALATDRATDRTFEVVSNPLLRDRALAVDWRLPE